MAFWERNETEYCIFSNIGNAFREKHVLPDQEDPGARPEEVRNPKHPESEATDVHQGELPGTESPLLCQGPLRIRSVQGRSSPLPNAGLLFQYSDILAVVNQDGELNRVAISHCENVTFI